MPVHPRYANLFLPTKWFLSSYRAWNDGNSAIRLLEKDAASTSSAITDWKIHWIGACSLLRGAIDLFRADSRVCVSADLRSAVKVEWKEIKEEEDKHRIYWEFIREERNNILHEYKWTAYEEWLDEAGRSQQPGLMARVLFEDKYVRSLKMKSGPYKGRDSVELMQEASAWVEERILSAIARANLDPEEDRNLVTFEKRKSSGGSLITGTLG
ncbi:hypothetical protein [uncultured Roseobacter sp.]|uniref:hypothetical protein n=1 Tax=uncultured Roseobacter sp. TaxID=114847 RepID=UPI002634BEF1|nr:hypothetical protein [uncultured Roseobacter sp.]